MINYGTQSVNILAIWKHAILVAHHYVMQSPIEKPGTDVARCGARNVVVWAACSHVAPHPHS